MKSNIRVSVVIPTYNRARTVGYCIDSVLKQTFPAFEIIVVDDNSTDDTAKIVKSITNRRIRLIILPLNKGAQAARNIGIKNAQGNYIAFLDSDDEWVPEKLELQVKEISKRAKSCVIHSDAWIFFEEKNEKRIFNIPKLSGFVYKELLSAPGPLYQCMIVPKECFEKIGFLDENVPSYQEWETSITLAKYYEFIFIDKPLMIYHLHTGETISKDKVKEAEGWRYIVEKHKDEILNNCGKKTLAKHYFQIGMFYYRAGKEEALEHFFESILAKEEVSDGLKCQILLSRGNLYANNGKYKEAEKEYKKVLALEPSERNIVISIHYALGSLHERKGEIEKAKEKFEEVIKLAKGTGFSADEFLGGAHFHLGNTYQKMGENERAKQHFKECLRFIPDHKKAKELIAR